MSVVPDDPRLTAYALGETLGPADLATVETLLATDPGARAFVVDLQATAALLTVRLRAESAPGLEPAQRQAIENCLAASVTIPPRNRRWIPRAVAAGLVGLSVAILLPWLRHFAQPERPTLVMFAPAAPAPATSLPPVHAKAEPGPAPFSRPGSPLALSSSQEDSSSTANPPVTAEPRADRDGKSPEMFLGMKRALADKQTGDLASQAPVPEPSATSQVGRVAGQVGTESLSLAPSPNRIQSRSTSSRMATSDKPAGASSALEPGRQTRSGRVEGGSTRENPFMPVSTLTSSSFEVACETTTYALVRETLRQGTLPARESVRIEELLNYFPYDYAEPKGVDPVAVNVEIARCPWAVDHRLVRIGLKGREARPERQPRVNLVYLVETSPAMNRDDGFPLFRAGVGFLTDKLSDADRVAVAVYGDADGLALASTPGSRKTEMIAVLDRLARGGPTLGGKGLSLAYATASQAFIAGGVNRVLLVTTGDRRFSSPDDAGLLDLIEVNRAAGVSLSVLALGRGHQANRDLMRLAERGQGSFDFLDSINRARQVVVDQRTGPVGEIARDVAVRVRFNPLTASAYRLIGFDTPSAPVTPNAPAPGWADPTSVNAGHCMTAFYEVVPRNTPPPEPIKIGESRVARGPIFSPNQAVATLKSPAAKLALCEVDVNCRSEPSNRLQTFTCPADDRGQEFSAASPDFKFAATTVGFGLLLRDSPYKGSLTWPRLLEQAAGAIGTDPAGYRKELLDLVRKASEIPTK